MAAAADRTYEMGLYSFRALLLAWRENADDLIRAWRWRRFSLAIWILCIAGFYALLAFVVWCALDGFLSAMVDSVAVIWNMLVIGVGALCTLLYSVMLMPETFFLPESHWRKLAQALRRSLRAQAVAQSSSQAGATTQADSPIVAHIPAHEAYRVVEPEFTWIEEGHAFLWYFSSWFVLPLGLLLAALAYLATLPNGWMQPPERPQDLIPVLLASAVLIAMGVRALVAGIFSTRRRAAQQRGFVVTADELGLTFRQPTWSRRDRRILWKEIESFASLPYADSLVLSSVAREPERIVYLIDGGAHRLMWEISLKASSDPLIGASDDGQNLAAMIARRIGLPVLDLNDVAVEIAKRLGHFEERFLDEAQAVAVIERDTQIAAQVERARGRVTSKSAVKTSKRVEEIVVRWSAMLHTPGKVAKGTATIQRAGWLARSLLPYYPTESPLVEGHPMDVWLERAGGWLRRWHLWLTFSPIIVTLILALALSMFTSAHVSVPHGFWRAAG
jgi:hypothetical protein